ncbi:hypothetical protein FJY68_12305 [candidate division WOR-3 bacterium]|uniref:Uncharacterized protein n=1 Tax=candidate division WOR-3 bacterium TaxID=2052148 RepID=A0A938BQY5_UNCW3|nr:hypothetical protein [candidate division WOR-3 bacterium]
MTFAFSSSASAQSFFNSRGLGEITPPGEARVVGLAGPSALSTLNPGIFVDLNQVSFHVTTMGAATLGAQGGNSRLLADVRPAAFNVAAPLPFGTRVFGGINQKFSQDFDIWSESLADTAYRRHIIGRGGIYALRAGLAKSLFDKVCIGAEFNHVLGGSRENWRFELDNGGYTSTDTIEVDYLGNTLKVGGSFQSRLFSLAGYYEPSLNLKARRSKRVHGVISDTTRLYVITLPHSFSLAAGVNPISRFGVDIGLTVNPWSTASIAVDDSVGRLGYRNVWRGSIGAEYEIDSLHPVRIGYSRQTWYYDATAFIIGDGYPITEDGVHFGTSVPVPKFGSVEVSGEILFRNSLVMKEVAGRLMLTLSYSEAWSRRTRRWGY